MDLKYIYIYIYILFCLLLVYLFKQSSCETLKTDNRFSTFSWSALQKSTIFLICPICCLVFAAWMFNKFWHRFWFHFGSLLVSVPSFRAIYLLVNWRLRFSVISDKNGSQHRTSETLAFTCGSHFFLWLPCPGFFGIPVSIRILLSDLEPILAHLSSPRGKLLYYASAWWSLPIKYRRRAMPSEPRVCKRPRIVSRIGTKRPYIEHATRVYN